MVRNPSAPRALSLLMAVVLLPLMAVTDTPTATASKEVPEAPLAGGGGGRSADLSLALVSRTFETATNNWTIVVDATLDSNYACIPLVWDCVVGELTDPPNADLVSLQCLSPWWNHLIVFRDHCLKQVGHAGQDSRFRFTYRTDPGVTTGTVNISVEFGRGVLPVTFQQLASKSLTVDLDTSLDLAKTCPDTVDSGSAVNCTITVSYPFSSGPPIAATIVDSPDGALITGGTLTQAGGTPTWTCLALTCSATVNAGESATFTYAGSAAVTATGGHGSNTIAFTAGGTATITDLIEVVGTGDAYLSIAKSTEQTSVDPGGAVTWTVTLTNSGGSGGADVAATNVELVDTAPAAVTGLTLVHSGGVGTWSCTGLVCTTASMPVGTATFTAAGTLSAGAEPGSLVVNDVGVTWFNDIFGPDYAETAGSAVSVAQTTTTTTSTTTTTTTTTTTSVPSSTTTTTGSSGGTTGTGISFAG